MDDVPSTSREAVRALARKRVEAYLKRAADLDEQAQAVEVGYRREAMLAAARRWRELAVMQEAIANSSRSPPKPSGPRRPRESAEP